MKKEMEYHAAKRKMKKMNGLDLSKEALMNVQESYRMKDLEEYQQNTFRDI
jgi:hypothetical protein